MSVIKLYEVAEAKATILRRDRNAPLLPEQIRQGIRGIFGEPLTPEQVVERILDDVRTRGDDAVRQWTERIDGVSLADARVPAAEIASAADRLDPELLDSLRFAAARIRAFHARQPVTSWTTTDLGGRIGQKVTPLQRVGVYVPGGSAPLPSSLLMSAIPAQVAGVPEIVIVTPPGRADGRIADVILATAGLLGIKSVHRIGGAQAVGAMAYGTASLPAVDKIVGAGNLFVTLAKRLVYGQVGLDGLFGPTETVVVADESADPEWVAADLLAQAEHDVLATAILFTPSRTLAVAVQHAVGRQLEERGRQTIIATALASQGGIVVTNDVAEAVALADAFAPEHLCLAVEDLGRWEELIARAGGIFLGERSFEVLGDYVAGPSHIMPTGGTARFASPLNCLDFVRLTSLVELDDATATDLSRSASRLALAEGLDAHAHAATLRAKENSDDHKSSRIARNPVTVRPNVAGMASYKPILPFDVLAQELGRAPDDIVKLDANENPFGPSPRALAAVADTRDLHIYPDPASRYLREALATFTGLPVGALVTGAGADELIDLVLRAVIEPGDVILNCPPSFGMYPFSTAVNAGRLIEVPRKEDFELDVPGIQAAVAADTGARILLLCSPNNPTGNAIADDTLRTLLRLPVLVVLDEAYIEFSDGESRMSWVPAYDNLVVLRTFSKWAGLAGLRVGYGAFPPWLAEAVWRIKQPYNVNVLAQRAAVASLADSDYLWRNVDAIKAERQRLYMTLAALPHLTPYPSEGNFILCRVNYGSARGLRDGLAAQGVLVRYFDTPGLRNMVRFSVGKPADNQRLISALETSAEAVE